MGETQEIPKLGTIKKFGVNYELDYTMGVIWARASKLGGYGSHWLHGYMAIGYGYMAIIYMTIGYGYWLLANGYEYWLLTIDYGYIWL
jgi:hypothetical protein